MQCLNNQRKIWNGENNTRGWHTSENGYSNEATFCASETNTVEFSSFTTLQILYRIVIYQRQERSKLCRWNTVDIISLVCTFKVQGK